MKQGNTFYMPIKIGFDMEMVESVDFCFEQGRARRIVHYPSDEAKDSDGQILVKWTPRDTWPFDPDRVIQLDTRISLKESDANPDTDIIPVRLRRTLFRRSDFNERDELHTSIDQ